MIGVEVDVAVAERAEVPAAPDVAEGQERAEEAGPAVEGHGHVLHVDVVDAVGEIADEQVRLDALPDEVARVEVEAQGQPAVEGVEQAPGRVEVEGDLGRVDLEGELDALLVELVEDGRPEGQDLLESGFDRLLGRRGEGVPGLPDGRAHEAVDDVAAHIAGRPGGGLHLVDGPLAQGLGLALDGVGGEAVQARIVLVADALAGEVGAERPALESVLVEDALPVADIGGVGRGLADVHVVAPAGDLQAVVAPGFGLPADLFERQVGPLAGEQGDGSRHDALLDQSVFSQIEPRAELSTQVSM